MSGWVLPEVLLLTWSITSAGLHTHYFYVTVTSEPTYDLPLYSMTRALDDITLMRYDSDREVVEPKVSWFQSPFSSFLNASWFFNKVQKNAQTLLLTISRSLGQTEGFHVLQVLAGCSLHQNGSVRGTFTYHYDGKPFMYMDMEAAHFIAETPGAEKFAKRFNSNSTILQGIRHNLVNTCIPHITELLSLGNCTFYRREEPVIRVTQIPMDDVGLRLSCRAYGHYPKDIFMMWYKNGEEIPEEMMERVTLPLPDITYLTSSSLNVTSGAGDTYSCKVGHSSMRDNVTHQIRISGEDASAAPSSPSIGAVTAICLAIVLIIVIIVFSIRIAEDLDLCRRR
ncbi:major histocompatibility complex class I-related gene protein-like [Engystomops pustulosus]|uniref:major histocompatibility complex class I-related gene protein-like n=1 Tax=Engystomops pustulosus TaxID=76066 RepID=UPI003AFB0F99